MKTMIWKFIVLSSLSFFTLNAYAEWECFAADKKGHLWSSAGSTQERANTVALSFCSAFSPNAGSCHMSNCVEK